MTLTTVPPLREWSVRIRYTVDAVIVVEAENGEEAAEKAIHAAEVAPGADLVDWEVRGVRVVK